MTTMPSFVDEPVRFAAGSEELFGRFVRPTTPGPYPAIVLLHGSDRVGADDPYYTEHAETLVRAGFAVLRYDGPGWGGQSTGQRGFETFQDRTEEAISAVRYLQSRADVKAEAVGLWGISQGGWICQMAAAAYPVAFIIPVSGPGVTAAEQEVYRVEAQSREAGMGQDEVARATLMRRLMVDIVLEAPIYRALNRSEAQRLGPGPWDAVLDLVYRSEPVEPGIELEKVIEVLRAIKDEPWTRFLHLGQVLPMFERLPPQAWTGVKAQLRAVLEVEPADYLTKVHCPVLAIFGAADTSVPVERSVALYEQYLGQAGNEAVTIEVFAKANHTLRVGDRFAPDYWQTMLDWLTTLH